MGHLAWACAALVAAAGCAREPGKKEDRMGAEVLGADAVKHCAGRFCLTVPAAMARSADGFEVQGVTLEEVAWEKDAPAPWEREWLSRLQKIEALKERREIPTLAYGTIVEQRMFKPGVLKGVLFNGSASATTYTFGAVYNAGPLGGLWLEIDTGASQKEEAAQRIADIAPAYRVAEPGEPAPRGAFHLVRGYLAAPFKLAEEAHARFAGQKLELTFHYETTFEPKEVGLMERFTSSLEKSAATLFGLGAKPLRNQKRKVAGLPGEEMVVLLTENGKSELSFLWTAPGEAGSGKHPEMKIEFVAPDDRREERLKLWDALLDEVKPAP